MLLIPSGLNDQRNGMGTKRMLSPTLLLLLASTRYFAMLRDLDVFVTGLSSRVVDGWSGWNSGCRSIHSIDIPWQDRGVAATPLHRVEQGVYSVPRSLQNISTE